MTMPVRQFRPASTPPSRRLHVSLWIASVTVVTVVAGLAGEARARPASQVKVEDVIQILRSKSRPTPADLAVAGADVDRVLVDLLVADVSFISLRLALPMPAKRLRPGGRAYVLVKPQFEAGRAEANKGGGVVRDPAVRERCVREVAAFAESALGWREVGVVPSPITGPAGNQEYIAVFASQMN